MIGAGTNIAIGRNRYSRQRCVVLREDRGGAVALRVYGVKAVANDLTVRLVGSYQRTDTEIAQAALAALKWNTVVPDDRARIAWRETV